jgi:hypothetical protein
MIMKHIIRVILILVIQGLIAYGIAYTASRFATSEELMALAKDQIISAQVVLRSASGKSPDGNSVITTETIRDFLPSDEMVSRAIEAFAAAGFNAGAVIGNSFSISAPVNTFERVFKTHLRRQEGGSVEVVKADNSGSYELPLDALPRSVTDLVAAVTFTPAPDFGPTKFGP